MLNAASLTPDEARIKSLVAALSGVDLGEVIKSAGVAVSAPASIAIGKEESKAIEAKKEEEKKEEEEGALEGLAALFG